MQLVKKTLAAFFFIVARQPPHHLLTLNLNFHSFIQYILIPQICMYVCTYMAGYRLQSGATIGHHHLLYMHDIKLLASNERDIDSLILLTRIYSDDIGTSFGLNRCGQMVSKRGKMIRTEGVELPESSIADVQDSYKYLGVLQANGNHEEVARKSATAKYLNSQLNGKNKVRASLSGFFFKYI